MKHRNHSGGYTSDGSGDDNHTRKQFPHHKKSKEKAVANDSTVTRNIDADVPGTTTPTSEATLKWQPVETPQGHYQHYPGEPYNNTYNNNNNNSRLPLTNGYHSHSHHHQPPPPPSSAEMHSISPTAPMHVVPPPSTEFVNTMHHEATRYCICQSILTIPKYMILCDHCQKWFHGACMGLTAKEGEFFDLYYCKDCTVKEGKKSTRRQLNIDSNQWDLGRLARMKEERIKARAIVKFVDIQTQFLNQVVESQVDNDPKVCGYDSRLAWQNGVWNAIKHISREGTDVKVELTMEIEGVDVQEFTVCNKVGKCQKHEHWRELRQSELEVERRKQIDILTSLDRKRKQIKSRISDQLKQPEGWTFLDNGTICHD
ncbi:hypothetical protein BDA99DRAFT_439442 [Phascolomyces articulosus]|uniref:PHD-type domain-containing protein n=1 Tax=Phascolomyces articulosus TaxID=60185 RepID=A0AAD5K7Y3_9FUNG|nr:hypothetical protein BDA99DRAFT_439442 [Phascolomyces articulosus]